MLLTAVAQFCVPVMTPAIAADLAIDASWLGIYSTILWTTSLATSGTAGYLIARFGAWRLSQTALIVCGLGLIAAAAGNLPLAALSAALIGISLGVETPASSTILARVTPPARAPFIFSFKQTGLQIGAIATGAALPAIALAFGWQAAFAAIGVGLLIASFLLVRPRHTAEPAAASGQPLSFRQAIAMTVANRPLLVLSLVALTFVATQACLATFLVTFFVADHGVALVVAGGYLAASQVGGLIGRLFWGTVAGRWFRPHRVLVLLGTGMTLVCIALGTPLAALSPAFLYTLTFVGGFCSAGWTGIYLAELARLAPTGEVARITSASFVISSIGLIFAPGVFSLVAATTTYSAAFIAAAALSACGVMLLVGPAIIGRSQRSREV